MIIVGVSGGVDSMVLLDKLYKANYQIVIAHVDYQKRSDSKLDAQVIMKYIEDKNIVLETLIVDNYKNENFQTQARHIRYAFYKELMLKYQAKAVYLAHHRDDDIETAIFKIRRKGLYDYIGIKPEAIYQGMQIRRPLLSMYKQDVIEYATTHNIAYHEDSSNMTLDYTRNQIRAELTKLSMMEKEDILKEASYLNTLIIQENDFVSENLTNKLPVLTFNEWSLNIKRRWLFKQLAKYDITIKHLDEIIRKIQTLNSFKETILDTTVLKSYDIIYILDMMPSSYSYQVNDDNDYQIICDYFLSKYGLNIVKPLVSYPYLIRDYEFDDFNKLDLDYKKIRIKLKKKHIPFFIREYLPVAEQAGEVICFLI